MSSIFLKETPSYCNLINIRIFYVHAGEKLLFTSMISTNISFATGTKPSISTKKQSDTSTVNHRRNTVRKSIHAPVQIDDEY